MIYLTRWLTEADLPLCQQMSAELARAVPFVLPVSAHDLARAVNAGEVVGVFADGELSAFFRITERPEGKEADTVEIRSVRSLKGGIRDGLGFVFAETRFLGKRFAMVVLENNDKMLQILTEFDFFPVQDFGQDAALRECMDKDTGPRPAERLLFVRSHDNQLA